MLAAYVLALGLPLVVMAIKLALPDFGLAAPFLMFMSAIVFVTAYAGPLPGLVATVTSIVAAAVYFLPPVGQAAPATTLDLGQLLVFGIEALFIVAIVGALRRAAERGRPVPPRPLTPARR